MIRVVPSILIAFLVTLGLLLMMVALIKMAQPNTQEKELFKVPDFVFVPKNEDVRTITPKPKLLDIAEQPDTPDIDFQPDIDITNRLSLGTVKLGGFKRNLKGFNSNDGEYLPIFRAPPIYPRRATERGLCGWVRLSYTVTASGGVRDPIVVESSSSVFETAAKRAALKYKYKPRQVGGKPVDVPNVEVLITFELRDDKGNLEC